MKTISVTPNQWIQYLLDPATNIPLAWRGYQTVKPGWRFDRRILDGHLIWVILGGRGKGIIENTEINLEAGHMLWLAPGIIHDFFLPDKEQPLRLYFFRIQIVSHDSFLTINEPFLQSEDAAQHASIASRLFDELAHNLELRDTSIRSLFALILTGIIRGASQKNPESLRVLSRDQRQRIADYFQDHAGEHVRPSDLAQLLNFSPIYFARIFRNTFGCSPRKWLVKERMRLAASMIDEYDLNVTQIARRLGYEEVFLFSRQFKEIYGKSPLAFRKRT
jgi:AraC-like DNA-binding protein